MAENAAEAANMALEEALKRWRFPQLFFLLALLSEVAAAQFARYCPSR